MRTFQATRTIALVLAVLAVLAGTAAAQPPSDDTPDDRPALTREGFWIVKIEVPSRDAVDKLVNRVDVWRIFHDQGYVEAALSPAEYRMLEAEGFRLTIDEARTRSLDRVGVPLKLQATGIPGFPCYRTVEETYATAEAIVAAHPDLATWTDIGDSWDKTQDPQTGYDVFVLKLTQSAIPGPKPVFFAHFAIHAREYTTAELGTRFAEMLVNGYGTDPDVTWLLDHHEVHLVLQANPDGRKKAESGLSWRKNVNNNYCSNTNSRGADLNRNFTFEWACCGGSGSGQCDTTYHGASAGSEPEIQALEAYAASIFPDQRGPNLGDPAPADATGVAIDVHSSGQLVLWPWGFTFTDSPNAAAFATLGRKLAFFNGHTPLKTRDFSLVDGDSLDHYYGELGVAGLAFELGTQFFQDCSFFEANVLPGNLDALLYAAKVARTPYLTPAGPEGLGAVATPSSVTAGELVTLSATLDDIRFNNSNGTEPTQTVAFAEAFVDTPPWDAGAAAIAMSSSDGTFDEGVEWVEVVIDTTGFTPGRHLLFVQGTDTAGNAGVVTAAFLDVTAPCIDNGDCDDGLFCNGAEVCNAGVCGPGTDPCPGQSCDETGDVCVPFVCDDDGVCESGEDCATCPGDCPSFPLPSGTCGNGLCEAGDGEDCLTCPADCNGQQGGKPGGRFCCGFGGENPVGCGDAACTTGGFDCTETPQGSGGSTCCGDLACETPEDGLTCELDCGPAVDCSTFADKTSCNAEATCHWDNKNQVCVPN